MHNQAVMSVSEANAIAAIRASETPTMLPKPRLKAFSKQLTEVAAFAFTGLEYSLADISLATGHSEASVSARLRDLRKPEFGSNVVEKVGYGGTYYYTIRLSADGLRLLADGKAEHLQ